MIVQGGEGSSGDTELVGSESSNSAIGKHAQPSVEANNEEKSINDVCLNDPIGSTLKHDKVHCVLQQNGFPTQCFDDMHVFNSVTCRWSQTICSLSPLPRKGHSLSVGRLRHGGSMERQDSLILFGGYSSSSNMMSNSLHVCSVADALAGKAVWRTLSCKGSLPCPRYRHTCVVLKSGNLKTKEDLLVIFGGIGESMQCLNDLHILDLGSLTWTPLAKEVDGDVSCSLCIFNVTLVTQLIGDMK